MPNDFKGIMGKEVAGLPTWVWIVVVVAGIGAAYVIPRLVNKQGTGAATSTSSTGDSTGSGLGLAIDPTTGLPYAVEGLVPSGGTAGTTTTTTPTTPTTPTQQGGTPGVDYGLIPFGTYTGPSYSNLKPNTYYQYGGTTYLLSTGPQGKLYGSTGTGQKVLLYEPVSFYPGGVNYNPTWPGGTTQVRASQ